MKTSHKWFLLNSGGATSPPFEWFESFAQTQQPITDPLIMETGQSLTIVAQSTDLSIQDNYLRKAGTSGGANNKIRSVESVYAGAGRLYGCKVVLNNGDIVVGLETTSAGTPSYAFYTGQNKIQPYVRFEVRDIGFSYVNDQVYHLFILLKSGAGAFWIIEDNGNYYLALHDTANNYTEHKLYYEARSSTLALVDWIRVNPVDSLASDWPFDTDALVLPSAGTSFTHDVNGWIILRLGTGTTSGNLQIKFRIQDASNYFSLVLNTSNKLQLSVWVAGVETVLRTFAQMGALVSSQELKIFLNGSTIKIWGAESTIKANITNSNFLTATNGEVTSLGNGTISWLRSMPYDITSIIESVV